MYAPSFFMQKFLSRALRALAKRRSLKNSSYILHAVIPPSSPLYHNISTNRLASTCSAHFVRTLQNIVKYVLFGKKNIKNSKNVQKTAVFAFAARQKWQFLHPHNQKINGDLACCATICELRSRLFQTYH